MADSEQVDGKGRKEGGEYMVVGYVTGSPFLLLVIFCRVEFKLVEGQEFTRTFGSAGEGLASRCSRRIALQSHTEMK